MAELSQPERRGLEQMQSARPDAAQAGAEHPDADLLTAFAEQSLTEREREDLLSHLATCVTCREIVSLAMPELPVVAQPQAEPVKPLFWKWPVLRWGAVAASVVIVVAAVSIGNMEHNRAKQQMAEFHSDAAPSVVTNAPVTSEKKIEDATKELPEPAVSGVQRQKIRYEKVAPPAAAPKRLLDQAARADNASFDLRAGTPTPIPQASFHGRAAGGLIEMKDSSKAAPDSRVLMTAKDQVLAEGGATSEGSRDSNAIVGGMAKEMSKQPPPPPPPQAPAAEMAKLAPGTSAETVTVQAQASSVETAQRVSGVTATPMAAAKSKKQEQSGATTLADQKPVQSMALRRKMRFEAPTDWHVNSNGWLQRSYDHAQTWEQVLPGANFHAVATIGNQVWAGGANGLLMHSSDAGETWAPVSPGFHGDVVSLQFTDALHGTVKTSAGETWETSDGGKSWKKQ